MYLDITGIHFRLIGGGIGLEKDREERKRERERWTDQRRNYFKFNFV